MPVIVKNVFRTMWRNKMTYIASIVVIAVGICCYVALSTVSDRLVTAKEAFYEEYNFADVFVRVTQAPESVTDEIEKLEGVAKAESRLSLSARVVTDDKDKIVTLRVYGLDTQTGAKSQINGIKVAGQTLEDSKDILVGLPFYNAHSLKEGDTIELSVYGKRAAFTVRGAFNSPEYIYVVPENGSLMSDPYSYEIAFMPKETLENISGQKGIVTDIGLLLSEGYTFDDVKSGLSELLEGYGIVYALPRKDQLSNQMIDMEFDSVSSMATGMSGLFLMVAAAILYIMLRRLVEQERTQIGVLKAFGYTNLRVISNYMLYGLITGLIGGIIGAALGVMGGSAMYDMYILFFNIPPAELSVASSVIAYFLRGVLASAGTGMVAALLGVWGALKLKPADAMRPPSPPVIKKSLFENTAFYEKFLTKRGIMTLRYLERNKFKASLIIFSISLSYFLMALMFSYTFLVDKMMYEQFTKIETYDMKVTLKTPVAKSEALSGITGIKGVNYAEAVLEAPFSLSHENISKTITVSGLNADSPVYKIMDSSGVYYNPPKDGLLLSRSTAEDLGVRQGDIITLESRLLRGKKELRAVKIADLSLGSGAFIEADSLSGLLDMPPVSNGVVLTAEPGMSGEIKEALINAENVGDISDKEAILKSYHDMLDSYISMIWMILFMAIIIAFAIIYNISGVSLSERQRELATMRVLGYNPGETYEILSFENYILCILAILAGIPLTMFGFRAYGQIMESDLFTMPGGIPAISYVYSGLCCVLSVFLSNIATLRSVKKFELVEVLKERE